MAENKTTSPAVSRLLDAVDQFNQIARDAFAADDKLLGARAIVISAEYLQVAKAMQRMHDAFEGQTHE
jgi:hypothetical protein